jgi:hypothetical protein
MIKDSRDNGPRNVPVKRETATPPEGKRFSSTYQPEKRKGPSITTEISRQLREVDPATGREMLVSFVTALLENACRGSHAAIREILGRIDGPLPQKIEGLEPQRPIINFVSKIPDEDDSLRERPSHPMQKFHEEIDAALLEETPPEGR